MTTGTALMIALHEGAHALAAHRMGAATPAVFSATIVGQGDVGGFTEFAGPALDELTLRPKDSYEMAHARLVCVAAELFIHHAGLAMSEMLTPEEWQQAGAGDLRFIADVLALSGVDGSVAELLDRAARASARRFVDEHFERVVGVADELLERGTISAADLARVAGSVRMADPPAPLPGAVEVALNSWWEQRLRI